MTDVPITPAAQTGDAAPYPDRRLDRVDDASALDEAQAIDPRELDAMVRIDEGATVDDEAPVAGVRYDGDDPAPHGYGRPADAYGPEYGSGRIGFDHVTPDVAPDAERGPDA